MLPPAYHAPRRQRSCLPALLVASMLCGGGFLMFARAHPTDLAHRIETLRVLAVSPTPIVLELVAQPRAHTDTPAGCPLGSARTVLTQGYGVGSHAPAAIWGGVDLAVDGDGDGNADPAATLDAPIYATHDGTARVRPNTWPAGNYLAITNDHYKTAFAHLARYAVDDGATVQAGQIVGYIGVTGSSTGPHLHYEVWHDGVNVNPLDYGALGQP